MPDFETIRFKLDSGIRVIDGALLHEWIIDQISKRSDKFEYVEGWQDDELGTDPEDVVIPSSLDSVFHLTIPFLRCSSWLPCPSIPFQVWKKKTATGTCIGTVTEAERGER